MTRAFGVGRVRLLAAALLAALATALAAGAPNSVAVKPCSPLYRLGPTGDAGPGRAPLLIGDSVVGFAMPELRKIGYRINAQGCRTFRRGIAALKEEASERRLPRIVVFELGTAGPAGKRLIRKALRVLGPRRTLALVTPRVFGGGIDPDAANFHRAAERYPDRVTVVTWAETSEGHPEWFYGDYVHPNRTGVMVLSAMLAQVLK